MSFGYWELTLAILIPALLYASWIDYSERRVPNWLNASLAAGGLITHGVFFGWQGVGIGVLGLLVGLGVLILPWAMHGMGAGDVKLMGAIGAWLGPWLALLSFAAGGLIGGALALVMIFATGRTIHAYLNLQTIVSKFRRLDTAFSDFGGTKSFGDSSQLLPYGVPLTAGTIGVLLTYYIGGWLP
jgi:prepilin peptidase CpaA